MRCNSNEQACCQNPLLKVSPQALLVKYLLSFLPLFLCSECGVKTVIVSRTPKLVNRNKPRTILGVKPTDEHIEEALARSKKRNAGKIAKPIGMFDFSSFQWS